MRVFHFLNSEFGMKDLHERRIKIARIMELNDPFEFLGVDLSNASQRVALKRPRGRFRKMRGFYASQKTGATPYFGVITQISIEACA